MLNFLRRFELILFKKSKNLLESVKLLYLHSTIYIDSHQINEIHQITHQKVLSQNKKPKQKLSQQTNEKKNLILELLTMLSIIDEILKAGIRKRKERK
jgi:hypothetical protein